LQVKMRVAAVILAALAFASATAEANRPPSSGLRGTVLRSPTRPVCLDSAPCSAPAAGITLQFWRAGALVARVRTGPAGGYAVRLASGSYLVKTPQAPRIGAGLTPRAVRVPKGRVARVDFVIDTGIQ
jgi:hypothetical protein